MVKLIFGKFLRNIRKMSGLTQKDVYTQSNVHFASYSSCERGERGLTDEQYDGVNKVLELEKHREEFKRELFFEISSILEKASVKELMKIERKIKSINKND